MKRHSLNRVFRDVVLPIVVCLGAVVGWELLVDLLGIPEYLLPAPSKIARAIAEDPQLYLTQSIYTLQATLIGFVLAVVLGVGLAVLIVQFKFLEQTLYSLLVTLNGVPKVAIAPLFIVWMGTGLNPKIAVAAMIAIFAIVIDMVHGLKAVNPEMIELGRSARGSPLAIMLKIRFPQALPALFAGMKVGISLALVGAIIGEFVASNRGLGYTILVAQGQFDIVRMFAALAVLSLIGLVLFYGIVAAERIFVPWRAAQSRASAGGH
jgi:NitT/TauT family transport system permease protein